MLEKKLDGESKNLVSENIQKIMTILLPVKLKLFWKILRNII